MQNLRTICKDSLFGKGHQAFFLNLLFLMKKYGKFYLLGKLVAVLRVLKNILLKSHYQISESLLAFKNKSLLWKVSIHENNKNLYLLSICTYKSLKSVTLT